MPDLQIFALTSSRLQWLGQNQALIASNIANADTPGYKARLVAPFSQELSGADGGLVRTHARHVAGAARPAPPVMEDAASAAGDKHSGNTVSLQREMLHSAEVAANYNMTTNIARAMQQMLLSVART